MSRHPLPETGISHPEKHVRAVIETDHAVVMDKIKQETAKDQELQWLTEDILTVKWNKDNQDLRPYYNLRTDLYVADGVILRLNRSYLQNLSERRLSGYLTSKDTQDQRADQEGILVPWNEQPYWERGAILFQPSDHHEHATHGTGEGHRTTTKTMGHSWSGLLWTIS